MFDSLNHCTGTHVPHFVLYTTYNILTHPMLFTQLKISIMLIFYTFLHRQPREDKLYDSAELAL